MPPAVLSSVFLHVINYGYLQDLGTHWYIHNPSDTVISALSMCLETGIDARPRSAEEYRAWETLSLFPLYVSARFVTHALA